MKLQNKEFIKADGTVIKLTPEWISTKLGEVYELSHLDKIDQERLHYGYMTEALVSFLETTDEKGVPFFERVELKGTDYFRDRTNGSLSITNCVIKGQTTIDSAYEKDYNTVDGSYLITIDNSILKKAELIFNKDVGSKVSSVQISNSEIEGTFVAYDIEKVDGSIINNSLVANILSLKNSVLDSDEIRPDKIIELDGYNSAAKTIVEKPKIEIGKVTNELEIL